jgi:hypothetical protein
MLSNRSSRGGGSVSISLNRAIPPAALGGSRGGGVTNGLEVSSEWNANQVAMLPFERVPIVWARRVNGIGGVLVSPRATECRFSNGSISGTSIGNAVAVAYHLVLSDGRIGGIQVRDVFHGRCRVGQFSWAYGKRAGQWTPGNFLTSVYEGSRLLANAVVAPTFCGTTGTYRDLSTFSFRATYFNGFDSGNHGLPDQGFWKRQVHIFVRNGAESTRLLDNTYGSSNNLADLYLWLLTRDGRTPAQQVDRDSLLAAARFMDANGLFWNGVLREPASISDWVNSIGRFLLVRETKRGGRYGLRPLLPTTATGAIDTAPLTPDWVFDGNAIEPGSYQITFRDAESRRPFKAQMAWRQQGDDGLSGIPRTTPVYYVDTPEYAPNETFDLTQFGTSEIHAVRAGMFEQAKRRYCTHSARVTVVPGSYDARLGEGDLVAIQIDREDLDGVDDPIVEWYSITSMEAGREGRLILALEHFPVDIQGRSLVAMDVANATAAGDQFITGDSGPSCDENPGRATDTSIVEEDGVSRTSEEVYFYNQYGRFPDNNEYVYAPGGQPPSPMGAGGGGGGGGNGGGGGGATPPPQPPTKPSEPLGPQTWPTPPPGCRIECVAEQWSGLTQGTIPEYRVVCRLVCDPPPPADGPPVPGPPLGGVPLPTGPRTWTVEVYWESDPNAPTEHPGPGVFWVAPGSERTQVVTLGTTSGDGYFYSAGVNAARTQVFGYSATGTEWSTSSSVDFWGFEIKGWAVKSVRTDPSDPDPITHEANNAANY